ncbi:MAG: response regulator [Candidatus Omnitrophica bacterium]|nr:response regulator [Candidatus Omnitrophota bacterium]
MATIRKKFHDIGNKLNKIRLAAGVIRELAADMDDPKKAREAAAKIIRDCGFIEKAALDADQKIVEVKEIAYRHVDPDKAVAVSKQDFNDKARRTSLFLLEDDAEICEVLKDVYGRRGFTVHVALSGEEALDRLAQIRPEIALLDVHLLGKVSGVDILCYIKKEMPATRCLMITKDDTVKVREAVEKAGADGVLLKPLTLGELDVQLSAIMAKLGK